MTAELTQYQRVTKTGHGIRWAESKDHSKITKFQVNCHGLI